MSSAKNTEYLFVYGTLRDEINHPMSDLLQNYTHEICSATFQGKLFDAGSYPAAITSNNESDSVYGKLYTITDSEVLFQHLDPYEGYSPEYPSKSLFLRKKVSVNLPKRGAVKSWIYLFNRPTDKLTLISSGDYLSYLDDKG